jgi:death-on-curing protein
LATEPIKYLSFVESIVEHIELMRTLGELRYGVFNRPLLQSALARPQHAATYENADLPHQAATLCLGLIKNHPFTGGNKRTATHLTDRFLQLNGFEIVSTTSEVVGMVMAIESGFWNVENVTRWMREHTQPLDV